MSEWYVNLPDSRITVIPEHTYRKLQMIIRFTMPYAASYIAGRHHYDLPKHEELIYNEAALNKLCQFFERIKKAIAKERKKRNARNKKRRKPNR